MGQNLSMDLLRLGRQLLDEAKSDEVGPFEGAIVARDGGSEESYPVTFTFRREPDKLAD